MNVEMDEPEGQTDILPAPVERPPYTHIGHAQKAFDVLNHLRG